MGIYINGNDTARRTRENAQRREATGAIGRKAKGEENELYENGDRD